MTYKRKFAPTMVAVAILAAFVAGISVIGREARLVDVIILFFSGFGGGASLVATVRPRRRSNEQAGSAGPGAQTQ